MNSPLRLPVLITGLATTLAFTIWWIRKPSTVWNTYDSKVILPIKTEDGLSELNPSWISNALYLLFLDPQKPRPDQIMSTSGLIRSHHHRLATRFDCKVGDAQISTRDELPLAPILIKSQQGESDQRGQDRLLFGLTLSKELDGSDRNFSRYQQSNSTTLIIKRELEAPVLKKREEMKSLSQRLGSQFDIKDPLWPKQWHTANDELCQHIINVTDVWASGITGKHVALAIVDDGLAMTLDDLKVCAANMVVTYSSGSGDDIVMKQFIIFVSWN
ncbi:pheromone processing endoprotease [Melampsora larici-populina 98AG31]|uniref:Pheromone processing endoprotease n=1 Tax=Melampsora larici-populina (strain 98AG31 / pathotype 3-4-7) TaxID=747676 RepID=F4SDN2_MELLP|nr:pheromone processing endoprotease [Melampsora larici-populina 98AG31]EGF97244.1 pheromone processing endoprotease [Melampsora larici-populina 98AG31]